MENVTEMAPTYMYRVVDGKLESKLFTEGPVPGGWFEDKFKARDAEVESEPVSEEAVVDDPATSEAAATEGEAPKPRGRRK